MMKKINIVLIFCMLLGGSVFAQQLPQHTQFMFNDFTFNPAVAGVKDHYRVISNNRYQWTGLVDAPRTYTLSAYGPHQGANMGYGATIYNDVTGPTSKTGITGSYAYQMDINEDIKLSAGLAAGLIQYSMDVTKITFLEEDLAVSNNMYQDYVPDASAGIYVYSSSWFGGFSLNQLFNNRIKIYGDRSDNETRLKTHMFLYGGYKLALMDDIELEPSLLLKYVGGAPAQFEINAKAIYKKNIWAGLSYRHSDAIGILIGYNLNNQLFFGYSYDVPLTPIRKYSSGSHELMIGMQFSSLRRNTKEF